MIQIWEGRDKGRRAHLMKVSTKVTYSAPKLPSFKGEEKKAKKAKYIVEKHDEGGRTKQTLPYRNLCQTFQ